tara:strand:- start:219 stop:713 length:495 start_codon:yes stop_codon:yes gene_type:complete
MKNQFYKIKKDLFFNSIKFRDKVSLIKAVKDDWERSLIIINNKHYDKFYDFLRVIKKCYPKYLETILTLSNQCAHFYNYNKIFTIISEYDFHFSTKLDNPDKRSKICTEFIINSIIKQVIIKNTYNIYKIEGDVKIYRVLKIITIINLCINTDIVVKLEYPDKP